VSEFPFRMQKVMAPRTEGDGTNAADLEERLLMEESKQNLRGVLLLLGLTAYLALEVLAKA
jgi:hypothetical protein